MDLLSGQPFWFYKNGILNSYPALEDATKCDVVIMGGGITGALIAHHLVKAGLDVIIVEIQATGLLPLRDSAGIPPASLSSRGWH